MDKAVAAAKAAEEDEAAGGKSKKKKWSKGKVKEKANNAVLLDKATLEKLNAEVPKYKMITPSILVDRMRVNGSLARYCIKMLWKEGKIKPRTVKPLQDPYQESNVLLKKVLENKSGKKEDQTQRQFTNQQISESFKSHGAVERMQFAS